MPFDCIGHFLVKKGEELHDLNVLLLPSLARTENIVNWNFTFYSWQQYSAGVCNSSFVNNFIFHFREHTESSANVFLKYYVIVIEVEPSYPKYEH